MSACLRPKAALPLCLLPPFERIAFTCTSCATPISTAKGVAKSSPADPNDYGYISRRQTTTPEPVMCVAPTLEPRRMIRTPPVRGRHYAFSPASMALGSRRPMLRKRRARCWTVVNCCDCWPMPSVEMYCWWKRSTDCPGSTLRPVARPDRPGGPAGGFSRSTTDPFIDPAGYGRRRRSPRVDDAGAIPDVLRIHGGVCSEGLRNATCPRGPGHRQGEGGTSLQRAAQGEQLHARIRECQARGMSVRGTARVLECSTSTVNRCRSQTIAAQK